MTQINSMQSMLDQMQSMAAKANGISRAEDINIVQSGNFAEVLGDSLKAVNEAQQTAKQMTEAFEKGEDIPLPQVMLSLQQSSMAFQATLQVRNKLLSAYQEIMKMSV